MEPLASGVKVRDVRKDETPSAGVVCKIKSESPLSEPEHYEAWISQFRGEELEQSLFWTAFKGTEVKEKATLAMEWVRVQVCSAVAQEAPLVAKRRRLTEKRARALRLVCLLVGPRWLRSPCWSTKSR